MARQREIHPDEAALWLGVLLDAAFDATAKPLVPPRSPGGGKAQGEGREARVGPQTSREARVELLALASDFTVYPDDFPDGRRAELLLLWAELWLAPRDWSRLQARVRKKRRRLEINK